MRFQACTIFRQLLKGGPNQCESVILAKRIQLPSNELKSRYSQNFPIPSSATFLQNDNSATVVLLGTVHFSKQSVEEVSEIVKELHPNAILVELCRQRVSLLELDDKKFLEDAKNFDSKKLKDAAKGQNFVSGMLHAMLLKTYADIAKELGVAPGGEFRRAYHEMKKIPGCKLFLGDRPIQITIARAFQSLSVYELGQVLYHLTSTNPKPLDKAQLERYKDKDFVQAQFEEITRDVPAFKKIFHVFVDERDKCLAYSIQECVRTVKEPRVLAVVGMGHVDGISKYYGKMKQEDIVPLLLMPCWIVKGPLLQFIRLLQARLNLQFMALRCAEYGCLKWDELGVNTNRSRMTVHAASAFVLHHNSKRHQIWVLFFSIFIFLQTYIWLKITLSEKVYLYKVQSIKSCVIIISNKKDCKKCLHSF